MATIKQRGDSYKITVSCGYDLNGKQIRRHLTWTPEPGMTARQIKKELDRQAVLFEEKCRNGQVLDGISSLPTLRKSGSRTMPKSSCDQRLLPGIGGHSNARCLQSDISGWTSCGRTTLWRSMTISQRAVFGKIRCTGAALILKRSCVSSTPRRYSLPSGQA